MKTISVLLFLIFAGISYAGEYHRDMDGKVFYRADNGNECYAIVDFIRNWKGEMEVQKIYNKTPTYTKCATIAGYITGWWGSGPSHETAWKCKTCGKCFNSWTGRGNNKKLLHHHCDENEVNCNDYFETKMDEESACKKIGYWWEWIQIPKTYAKIPERVLISSQDRNERITYNYNDRAKYFVYNGEIYMLVGMDEAFHDYQGTNTCIVCHKVKPQPIYD